MTGSLLVALGSLTAFGAGMAVGPDATLEARAIVAVTAVLFLALATRSAPPAKSISVLTVALLAAVTLVLWQVAMLVALGVWALVARLAPSAAASPTWRTPGRVPVLETLACAAVTPIALGAWLVLVQPDLGDVLDAYVPDLPLPVLIAGAVAFAFVNAGLEELIWRGVFQDRLQVLGGPTLAIVVQAISFGVAHAHGVPRGPVGIVLAGAWAVMLGLLRQRSGGLLAPFLAHVVADATIAILILGVIRS